jgi:enoyl-CoA hydratase/carnithine racemase
VERGIHIEDGPDGVRTLAVCNPRKRNALDPGLLDLLQEALERPRADGAPVRALLLRGAGDQAFCSGYDIESLGSIGPDTPLPDEKIQAVLAALEAHPAPSVALVRGPAFGAGCDLACACDFRIADPTAVFSMPPARLGVVYAPEGLWRVTALVGPSRAKRMFLAARRVAAQDALQWGLLDELHATDQVEAAAIQLCAELAAGAPLAVSGMKRAFRALGAPVMDPVARAEQERLRRAAFLSEDAQEGRAAFLQKRSPRFRGR